MKKYLLKPNMRYNTLDVDITDGKSIFNIMKIDINDFIEKAEKFLNDYEDDVLIKSRKYYSNYGEAIEVKRDYKEEEIENDVIYLFVYSKINSGYCTISYVDLRNLVHEAKIAIRTKPKWEKTYPIY